VPKIVREYRCYGHGPFENSTGKCPHGCSPRFVVQEIRTAPAIRHASTDKADGTARSLAESYGMSDIPTVRDGESVMQAMRRQPTHAPHWGHVDHAAPGWSQRGEAPKTVSPQAYGAAPENRIAEVKSQFTGPTPIIQHQPFRPPSE